MCSLGVFIIMLVVQIILDKVLDRNSLRLTYDFKYTWIISLMIGYYESRLLYVSLTFKVSYTVHEL